MDLNRKVMLSRPDSEVKDIKVTEVINGCNTDLKIQIDLHYIRLSIFLLFYSQIIFNRELASQFY